MKPSADRAAAEALRVRRVSGLTALAISYVLSFVATALMLAPAVGGGWGVMIAIGGGFIGLPFLGFAALVLLAFQRSVSHRPLAWCVAAPPAIGAAWLIVNFGFNYRSQHASFPTYLAEVRSDYVMFFVVVTASMAAAAFYVIEPLIRRRFVSARQTLRDSMP